MKTPIQGRPAISRDNAREAKHIVRQNELLTRYAQGIGITRADGKYCVRVNLDKEPPEPIFAAFPKAVSTSGGKVRVVYKITGPVSAAVYA